MCVDSNSEILHADEAANNGACEMEVRIQPAQ